MAQTATHAPKFVSRYKSTYLQVGRKDESRTSEGSDLEILGSLCRELNVSIRIYINIILFQ